jgi:hypothetical protein
MKLQDNPQLPGNPDTAYLRELVAQLLRLLRQSNQQVNQASEGRIAAAYNAMTAAPTSGAWQQGDFVRNSAPTEQGTAGSKFVVYGWMNVASGTPGAFVQCRFLTGN